MSGRVGRIDAAGPYDALELREAGEAARADGKIEGRNEKIEERLRRDEQLEQIPPDVAGSGAAAKPREQKPVYDPWGLMPEDR